MNDVDVNFRIHNPAVRLQTAIESLNWVFCFATWMVGKRNRALYLQIQICKLTMVKHRDFTILPLNSKWRRFFCVYRTRNRAEKSQIIEERQKMGYPPPYQRLRSLIGFFARWVRKLWLFGKIALLCPIEWKIQRFWDR